MKRYYLLTITGALLFSGFSVTTADAASIGKLIEMNSPPGVSGYIEENAKLHIPYWDENLPNSERLPVNLGDEVDYIEEIAKTPNGDKVIDIIKRIRN